MDYKIAFKSLVDDITKEPEISKETWEHFLNIYEEAVKMVAGSRIDQVIFKLMDFEEAVANGISGYTLILQRDKEVNNETWIGIFEQGQKVLKVRATLERL